MPTHALGGRLLSPRDRKVIAVVAEVLVATRWLIDDAFDVVKPTGSTVGASGHPTYRWRRGRTTVTVSRTDDGWLVRHSHLTHLFGAPETVYEVEHSDQRVACWDVMARVIHATGDEDAGVRAGRGASEWAVATRDAGGFAHA